MKNILGLFLATLTAVASAQPTTELVISSGAEGGTYFRMIEEAKATCGQSVNIVNLPSPGGGTESISRLFSKQVNAALIQGDQIAYTALTDARMKDYYTLFAFHTEDLHFLVPRGIGVVDSTALGWRDRLAGLISDNQKLVNTPPYKYITDLRNEPILASGGSAITVQALQAFAGLPVNLVQKKNWDEVFAALKAGEARVALFVGGQPLGIFKDVDERLDFLQVSAETVNNKKVVDNYGPAVLNYTNMRVAGYQTLSTRALLVTRDYKSPQIRAALKAFRTCLNDNLTLLQEQLGKHPAWNTVRPNEQGFWQWLNLDD